MWLIRKPTFRSGQMNTVVKEKYKSLGTQGQNTGEKLSPKLLIALKASLQLSLKPLVLENTREQNQQLDMRWHHCAQVMSKTLTVKCKLGVPHLYILMVKKQFRGAHRCSTLSSIRAPGAVGTR